MAFKRTRAQWAARIRAAHKETVNAVLKLGVTLLAAKRALPHGTFLKMIKDDLPFRASTAQRLMKIASDPKLANAAHAQLLPPAWGALYELTKLDDETFKQAASSGAIHPAMTRKDAARRRYLTVQVVDRTHRIVAPIIRMTESKPKSTPLRLVISTPSPKAAVDLSGEIAPVPILLEKLERLEQAMKDLSTEVQQRGGIAAAGKVVERRIMAVVNRLWSLADHPPVRRMS